jgi:SHS2 domain-containing protein
MSGPVFEFVEDVTSDLCFVARGATLAEVFCASARLTGELVGERIDPVRHRLASDVKAATAHELALARHRGEFRATVTLDV